MTQQASLSQTDFIVAFLRLLRGIGVYPREHPLIHQGLRRVMEVISQGSEGGEGLVISVNRGYLFINGERIEVEAENYPFVRSMVQTFNDLGIGEMEFLPFSVSQEDLYRFFKILAVPSRGFDDLLGKMDLEGIRGIFIRPPLYSSVIDVRSKAKKLYFQTLALVKKYFQGDHPVPMVKIKAVATYMADILRYSEGALLGLTIIKNYDDYTYNHCLNVAILSLGLALRLGLDKKTMVALGAGALVHDIGKVKIPQEILNKPGRLTDDEWGIIKRHPVMGLALVLKQWGLSEEVSRLFPAILEHHVGMGFSGYPEFLQRKRPVFISRIIHVADFYDAVTTPRVYNRCPMPPLEAMKFLVDHSGDRFDPVLVKVFAQMMGVYPVGTVVKLSTGEWGMVIERPSDVENLDKPVVAVVADDNGTPLSPRKLDLAQESASVVGHSEKSPWELGLNPTQLVMELSEES